jgi:GNAT superfamily N-acetyltransferase
VPASRRTTIAVRPLGERDVPEADRIMRLAFGTFLGLPDPTKAFGDRQVIANRWRTEPAGVLGAFSKGRLVGSNVVSRWGRFGWFGPLTVRPDLWDQGIAKRLMEATMDLFSGWRVTHEGLFTFAQSPKHVGLYQRYGFSARFLTVVMEKEVARGGKGRFRPAETFSGLASDAERGRALEGCRVVTDAMLKGLDLSGEIAAARDLGLGDTVLVRDGPRVDGFAVCHVGSGTEAGSGNCYVKFGAAADRDGGGSALRDLLQACESFAARSGARTIEAGVNMARSEAHAEMLSLGFRTAFQGVCMQRPNEPGYNRPGVLAIDDLR